MSQNYKNLVFILTILFLVSCNNEELEKDYNKVNLNEIKQDLKLQRFSNTNISENVDVNWEKTIETQKDNYKIYEITAKEKKESTLQSDILQEHLKYQLVSITSVGQLNSYFVEAYSNVGGIVYPETITKLNNFTGTLNVFELNGENLGSVAVRKGRAKNMSENTKLNLLTTAINSFSTNLNLTSKIPPCDVPYYQIVPQQVDRYDVWTVSDKVIAINYVGTQTTTTQVLMSYPCDAPSSIVALSQRLVLYDYKQGSGSSSGSITAPQIFNELTGKAKCLNDLLTKNGNSFVQKLLANFAGKNSDFDIKLTSVDMLTSKDSDGNIIESNGNTAPPVDRMILISISTSKANSNSTLDLVRTILHEYIHADLYSKTFTPEFNQTTDFAKVLEIYNNQHGVMASLYINSMKEALKEFHKTILIDDYNKYIDYYGEAPSDAFYEALAWGGIRDQKNIQAWTDLPEDKKASIIKLSNRVNNLSRMAPCPN
jgi:hypothetical protein